MQDAMVKRDRESGVAAQAIQGISAVGHGVGQWDGQWLRCLGGHEVLWIGWMLWRCRLRHLPGPGYPPSLTLFVWDAVHLGHRPFRAWTIGAPPGVSEFLCAGR